jgi:hypothetical protein
MYGIKTTNKLHYFYQENQLAKLAFLALEKSDENQFSQYVDTSEKNGETLLDYHLIPQGQDQRLHNALKWIHQHLPHVVVRIHGLGFQGPLLCMIPKDKYAEYLGEIKKINWSAIYDGVDNLEAMGESYCSTDVCEIKL